jgi:hypothetical protein
MLRPLARRHNNTSDSAESTKRLAVAARSATIRRPMRRSRTPPLRTTAAARLRAWADQLEPSRVPIRLQPPAAPLVRMGGRWWAREELTNGRDATDP